MIRINWFQSLLKKISIAYDVLYVGIVIGR